MPRYARAPNIECRYCGYRISTVTDSRKHEVTYHGKHRTIIKRYRRCNHCGLQFTTVETYEDEENTNLPEDVVPFRPPSPSTGVYSQPPSIPDAGVAASDDPLPPKKPQASRQGRRKS